MMGADITSRISTSEFILAAAMLAAVLLHIYGLRRARNDLHVARREGIRNGSYILFRQNYRTERGRLHLKASLLVAALWLCMLPGQQGWNRGDVVLMFIASGAWHLNILAIMDMRERSEIIRTHRRLKAEARASGWTGPERRRQS